eukprot:328825-Pyramimonas_sp.AAC.1
MGTGAVYAQASCTFERAPAAAKRAGLATTAFRVPFQSLSCAAGRNGSRPKGCNSAENGFVDALSCLSSLA